MTDRVLTLEQVAERTGRPLATHRYWRHLGIGPKTFKLGRRVVALEGDADRWIIEQRGAADAHGGGTAA
jgi:predicted DNA-binding transcriptional regulator AlpA